MKILRTIAIINSLVFLSYGCKQVKENKISEEQKTPVVQVSQVLSLQPAKTITLPGELLSWNKVSIYSKVRGFVKELKVDRGSVVKKGQVLAILDAPEVIAELDQAKGQQHAAAASLNEVKARFSASRLTYSRLIKASKTKGAVALNELDIAQSKMMGDSAAVITAEGNLKAAQSHYSTKQELANYLRITAPFDGVVIERNISPGALIGAGDANAKPLFVLEDNSTLRLTVAIPESYSNSIHGTKEVTFKVNAFQNKNFKAVFGRSSESVLEKNRVMMMEFDVNNRKNELKAGMYAEVKLTIQRTGPTLFVPKSAVVSSSEKVFVIKANNDKAEWVTVKKGITLDTLIEVFGSVEPGDVIIKEASEELRDGQNIRQKNKL